jgi:hypothetical protein
VVILVDSYTLEIKLNRQEVESLTKKIYDLGFVGEEAINTSPSPLTALNAPKLTTNPFSNALVHLIDLLSESI